MTELQTGKLYSVKWERPYLATIHFEPWGRAVMAYMPEQAMVMFLEEREGNQKVIFRDFVGWICVRPNDWVEATEP